MEIKVDVNHEPKVVIQYAHYIWRISYPADRSRSYPKSHLFLFEYPLNFLIIKLAKMELKFIEK